MPKNTQNIKPTDRNKGWNRKLLDKKSYQIEQFEKAKSFLIICEGKNTEPAYFESFPVVAATVSCIGLGASRMYLVKQAIEIAKLPENKGKEIWCVFDYDFKGDISNIANDFNGAVDYAIRKGLKVAYSNDAFELWFLLHYQLVETALTRFEYFEKLGKLWDVNYERECKKQDFCRAIFARLQKDPQANINNALKHAQRLFENNKNEVPSNQNPCTKVYELVSELIQHIRK
jgi:RloB-like protein